MTKTSLNSLNQGPALRVKFAGGDVEQGVITGYASTFGGQPDSYGDVIAAGAFAASLRLRMGNDTPRMLFNHDTARPIGRWLDMREDGRGLLVRGQLNLETTDGREVYAMLKAGDISGLSIGFRPIRESMGRDGVNVLEEIDLREVSVVTFPANESANVTTVKAAREISSRGDLETFLRTTGGLSRGAAKAIAAGGWPALTNQPDETPEIERLAARITAATREFTKD